ncbi:hypothetical protein Tco_0843420 [Tanacetum coccineum]|uniref:Uncharacterized protein n=1 Tax=Tanacetum coccineum TaxID=301880 RepID=A0ABQ5B605_9ASTR
MLPSWLCLMVLDSQKAKDVQAQEIAALKRGSRGWKGKKMTDLQSAKAARNQAEEANIRMMNAQGKEKLDPYLGEAVAGVGAPKARCSSTAFRSGTTFRLGGKEKSKTRKKVRGYKLKGAEREAWKEKSREGNKQKDPQRNKSREKKSQRKC